MAQPADQQQLEKTLFTAAEIADRTAALGREIARDYEGREITFVGVLNGCVMFLADLMRQMELPTHMELIRASSYGSGTTSSGTVTIDSATLPDLNGRDIIIVDDIFDTGLTLAALKEALERDHRPSSIRTAVILAKDKERPIEIRPDYVGFSIGDEFVVGYGLDYAGNFRHLPYIASLRLV